MDTKARRMLAGSITGMLAIAAFVYAVQTLRADSHATGFRTDILWQIDFAERQILALEEAVPQEKYTWRPAEGVRSISEVYAHIAFGNYGLLNAGGFTPPQEVGWSMDIEKWDKRTTDKKELAEMIRKSMDHFRSTVSETSDADLERKVNFFGNELTLRNLLILNVGHLHEHLGQSIAYARMNGVVPPWTAAREAATKEKKN